MSDKEVTAQAIYRLEETIEKANAAAERLVRCAESISNPVYSVSMQGHRGELQILAVRHFQGQICITVEDVNRIPSGSIKTIGHVGGELIEQQHQRPYLGPPLSENKCSTLYSSAAEGVCPICGHPKRNHDGGF